MITLKPNPIWNVRCRIEIPPVFYDPSSAHYRGMNQSALNSVVYEQPLTFYVKFHKEDLPTLQQLQNHKVCLLKRNTKNHKERQGWDANKAWKHPTHLNGTGGKNGFQYGDGIQASGVPFIQMNPINTEWPVVTGHDNISTTCTLNPLDWYRTNNSQFGDPVLPMLYSDWKTTELIKLRGRNNKRGKYSGLIEQYRFKVRIEATDPANPKRRVIGTPSIETIVLYPKKGLFGIGGDFPNQTANSVDFFFAWGLKLR
jgi:hypothetical protein